MANKSYISGAINALDKILKSFEEIYNNDSLSDEWKLKMIKAEILFNIEWFRELDNSNYNMPSSDGLKKMVQKESEILTEVKNEEEDEVKILN